MKIGKYDVTIKDGDTELDSLPSDLPVFDFEGNVITYQEAKGGYLRQSDYSKKTAEVASMKKLLDELGVAPDRGVGIMRHLLGVVAELEEKGIVDPTTGEIVEGLGQSSGELTAEHFAGAQISPAVAKQIKELQQGLAAQGRDVGAMLSIMSKRDIQTAFPELNETHMDWVFSMARDNHERSPMEYAKALNDELLAWGQKTIDEHATKKKELKKQELERVPGLPGIDMFDENVKFSFKEGGHEEGVKVISPRDAAMAHMEAALKDEE
jgi:hypothetical protein